MPARRVSSESHTASWGSWTLVRGTPAPHLRPGVLRYTGWRERTCGPVSRTEVPVAEVPLILSFGPPTLVRDPSRAEGSPVRVTSFAAGLHARAVQVGHEGEGHAVQVDLEPLAARRFLGVPLAEIAHASVELRDLLGPEADHLVESLALAGSWEARFVLLDAVLTRRLAAGPPPSPDVALAFRRLAASDGRVRIAALAAEMRCSRRHLTSRFREELGLPPKEVARLLRFKSALDRMRAGEDWASIALACGYADQPHLNREFRLLADATPREMLARIKPAGGGGGVELEPFPFVQDKGEAAA